MSNKNSLKIIIPLLVVISLLAWIVSAAYGQGVRVTSPVTGSFINASNSGNLLFNATYLNITDGVNDPTNATFYVNFSATRWVEIGNSTTCTIGVSASNSCSGIINASQTINGTILPEGYYTVNVSLKNVTGSTAFVYIANISNMTTYLIDRTPPINVNVTGLSSGNNHSTKTLTGNLTLNVSVADTTSPVNYVLFQVWNGTINATYPGVREGTTSYWSTSLNVSHYADGRYNITFFVNDSAGNFNATANSTTLAARSILTDLLFDNTKPTATPSCSPTTVDTGDAFPCTCAGSDATSGINVTTGTSNSPEGTATPTSSGTFTFTCVTSDLAGNSQSATSTYTVEEAGIGSGSSSSGSSGSGSSGSATGSSGSSGPSTGNSTGSVGSTTGSGGSGQAQGVTSAEESPSGFSMAWIIAIIVIVAIVAGIIVMVKRKN